MKTGEVKGRGEAPEDFNPQFPRGMAKEETFLKSIEMGRHLCIKEIVAYRLNWPRD